MKNAANILQELVKQHCSQSWALDSSSEVRPFLRSLPEGLARQLFDLLTNEGKEDCRVAGRATAIPVVLIDTKGHSTSQGGGVLSGIANWDYAITVRNSASSFIAITTPSASMTEQQSMSNTTEPFDFGPGKRGEPVWSRAPWDTVIDLVETKVGLEERHRGSLVPLLEASWSLTTEDSPADKLKNSWETIDRWLADLEGEKVNLLKKAGFPRPAQKELTFTETRKAAKQLELLAKRAAQEASYGSFEENLLDGVSRLSSDRVEAVVAAVLEFVEALKQGSAVTISEFAASPAIAYSEAAKTGTWWSELTTETWEKLLKPLARGVTSVTLSIANRIDSARKKGFPAIVANEVQLECSVEAGADYRLSVERSIGRREATILDVEVDEPYFDNDVPPHASELFYKATISDSDTSKQARQPVISLAHFEPGIICHVEGMEPGKVQYDEDVGRYVQDAALDGSGYKDIEVYVADEDTQVCIASAPYSGDEPPEDELNHGSADWQDVSGNKVSLQGYRVEEDTYLRIWQRDVDRTANAVLDVVMTIPPEDYKETNVPCLTSSLVAIHQGVIKSKDKAAIAPPSAELEKIEHQLLEQVEYQQVSACWRTPEEIGDRQAMDIENGRLGLAAPGLLAPEFESLPNAFKEARDALFYELKSQGRPLRQVDFTAAKVLDACDRYLGAYLDWLKQDQDAAAWIDLVACYAGPSRGGAVGRSESTEPHVLLMSPLHPLKVAFNAKSQLLLKEGSKQEYCPLAGYLDPHALPGILRLKLASKDQESFISRVFLNAGSTDPFWTIFWSAEVFPREQKDPVLLSVLERLRLLRPGLNSGFSESLVKQAMREVEDLTPARNVFQVGLQGDSLSSGTCARAILDWCKGRATPTRRYNVFDERTDPVVPSDESLAYVAAEKPGALRWFEQGSRHDPLDILVVDDLETRDWTSTDREQYEAVLAPHGLFRFQTRADQASGRIVQVAYAIDPSEDAYGRSREVEIAAILEGPCLEAGEAHYRFSPNTEQIYSGLRDSDFVAVTSRDVDPACFIHGAGLDGGVLWDYELPTLTGMTSSSVGYYLVAKPRPAMISAIEEAVKLLIDDQAEAHELTAVVGKEIALRGMPVLRRLGGGGSQARGELGVLLSLRALQGKVNQLDGASSLPLYAEGEINLLIAVDPYWEVFERARKSLDGGSTSERPDILVISIRPASGDQPTSLLVTPLEIKFRSQKMSPAELGKALQQASNLGSLLEKIWRQGPTELWTLAGRNLLASCIEHGFRVGATRNAHGLGAAEWAKLQARVILDVLAGDAGVAINSTGRLIAFDNRNESKTYSLGQASETDTMAVGRADAIQLLRDTVDEDSRLFNLVEKLALRCAPRAGASESTKRPEGPAVPPSPSSSLHDAADFSPIGNHGVSDQPSSPAEIGERALTEEDSDADATGSLEDIEAGSDNFGARAASRITDEARKRVNDAFEGFVGNDNAVNTIKRDLKFASLQDPPALSETYLLTGPPSTGKTELSRRIAKALGLPFVALDGKAVDSRDKLFSYVRSKLEEVGEEIVEIGTDAGRAVRRYPPFVVLIDEVHLVKRSVQEAMLTLLEANDRKVTLKDEYAIVETATFLFATTRPAELDGAFKTRCREIPLRPYTVAEVAEMLQREAKSRSMFTESDDTSDILTAVAAVGRSVPRIALQILSELEREMVVSDDPEKPGNEHLRAVMNSRGVDEIGIGQRDLDVLEFLERQKGPIGEDRMIAMITTVDKDTVLGEIDPFLQKLGYVAHDRNGRVITQKGRDYLYERRVREQD